MLDVDKETPREMGIASAQDEVYLKTPEFSSEMVEKMAPHEVCGDSQPLPSETVFVDNDIKDCKIADIIEQAKCDGTYKDPYAGINFVEFNPVIKDRDGKVLFDEKVIFPDYFRENDVKIVASKYLANQTKRKEVTLTEMIDRVSDTITSYGIKDGYFKSESEILDFNYKLKYYQVHQYFAFNSPVYFNVGIANTPQSSACFVLDVEDSMDSIMEWISNESKIFKEGSGVGINLSKLRSSRERVRGGGFASGAISFLKASDTVGGVIKSGGTFRRSAKLACLNIDHPDIFDFIKCKDREEEKLRLIKAAGMKPQPGYELQDDVYLQNTNISVRVTDKFMNAVMDNKDWNTIAVTTGDIVDTFNAKDFFMDLSKHAWTTADPGIMFHDNTNAWNNIAGTEITSANPCIEFTPSTTNQSCNLASMNDIKFFVNGTFNADEFEDVVDVLIMAQDMLIDNSSYPTELIKKNSMFYRPLGLGFTNLGALIMVLGYPYDSDEARSLASYLSAYRTALAFRTSQKIAARRNPGGWWYNEDSQKLTLHVFNKHKDALSNISVNNVPTELQIRTCKLWDQLTSDQFLPLSNGQISLVAPAGTVSFLMGATAFGIEPDFSLIKYKTLSGNDGASIKVVNDIVYTTLHNLGYSEDIINTIISDMVDKDIPIEKSNHIKPKHVAIFDTAVAPENGERSIHYNAHIDMMAAVQPFISMSISKTVNMPESATVEDIYNVYFDAWRKGLKSIAIYRDRCKTEQVLTTSLTKVEPEHEHTDKPYRKRMPIDRNAKIHKFTINGNVEGYIIAGVYEDGSLGELFIEGTSFGSTLGGFTDSLSIVTSMALQHGVPLDVLVKKLMHTRFEPAGFSTNPNIRVTSSLVDYIFRYLAFEFLPDDKLIELGLKHSDDTNTTNLPKSAVVSGSPCPVCSSLMVRLGSCEQCLNGCYSSGACG